MKKLTVGMRSDELPVDQYPGSWRNARNAVISKKPFAISNEDGADNVTPTIGGAGTAVYPSTKKVIGEIQTSTQKILFFATTTPEDSEIGQIKSDGKYYPILKDAVGKVVLNFNENYPIHGTAENRYNNNTVISFTDYNNVPFILNVDCLPFGLEADFTVKAAELAKAQSLIKLFPTYSYPTIARPSISILDGQGVLPTGVYYPVFCYEAADGTFTSWGRVFNGVPIGQIGLGSLETASTGGVTGEASGKAIALGFGDIDTNFKGIKVGYIHVANGVTRAYSERTYTITGVNLAVKLTGSNRVELTLAEILTPNVVFDKVKTLTSLQKTLYAGGVEYDEEFNFQPYISNTGVKWFLSTGATYPGNKIYVNGTARNTYVGGHNGFTMKGFKSGEVYAFYVSFTFKNGKKSKAYHIPGRAANVGDRDIMNGAGAIYGALDGGANIYKYQVKNTHTVTNNTIQVGDMCFWENENEEYPLDPANAANVHPDFATIPGISAGSRKVRHHQFPDLTMLDDGVNSLGKFTNPDGGFGVGPYVVSTRPFGVSIAIAIPPGLDEIIDSYEFFYAQRSDENIRCIGSDVASELTGAYLRFNHFDLMHSKPGLTPTHVKPLCRWLTLGPSPNATNFVEYMDSHTIIHAADNVLFSNVQEYAYIGQDTTVPYNNTGYADCIIAKISPAVAMTTGMSTAAKDVVLFDLCIFRRDMYLGFQNQTLISMGTAFRCIGDGAQPFTYSFGGDIHITRHALNPLSTGTQYLHYTCESAANIPFRNEDLGAAKYFAPKYPNATPSWYGYDLSFNAINIFNLRDIYYPSTTCVEDDVVLFPTRVAISLVDGSENKATNWRIFKANSYYDMPKNKGAISKLTGSDKVLYIHHENTLFVAQIKDSLQTADGAEIAALGVTELFDRPPAEVAPTDTGVWGNQSQFACGVCEMGYYGMDRQRGVFYLLPQGSLTPRRISDLGMANFFKKYGQTTLDIDNPFIGNGYTVAYDTTYDRLIIVKKDGTTPFTISFSPELNGGQGGWVSFHDYSPNVIFNRRDGLFGIDNIQHKVFEHNSPTLKGKFYDGANKKFWVDVVFNDEPQVTKRFDNANWISIVEDDSIIYEKQTATHLLVYNTTQCTEEIDLAKGSDMWYGRDVKDTEETWNFNNFRDLVVNTALPFLNPLDNTLITSNISTSKSWYNKSKFVSKFAVFRIIYNNVGQKNFHLSYIGSNIKKSDR